MVAYISMKSLTMRLQPLVALEGLSAPTRTRDPLPLVNLFDMPRNIIPSSKAASAFVARETLQKWTFNRKVSIRRGSDRYLVPTIRNADGHDRQATRGQVSISTGKQNDSHDALRKMAHVTYNRLGGDLITGHPMIYGVLRMPTDINASGARTVTHGRWSGSSRTELRMWSHQEKPSAIKRYN
jgi:hypothetical protein